jgi:Zn finger protein HypA/HybF involved in hydrogenase expression
MIPYIVVIWRTLSKNISARQRENAKFLEVIQPWKKFIIKKIRQFQDKDHRYYACPQCHNTLRVPKGRGKIKISCPHCHKEFIRKT